MFANVTQRARTARREADVAEAVATSTRACIGIMQIGMVFLADR